MKEIADSRVTEIKKGAKPSSSKRPASDDDEEETPKAKKRKLDPKVSSNVLFG